MLITPFFAAAFCRRGARFEDAFAILDIFEALVTRNPYLCGEEHPSQAGLWVWESPPIARLPKAVIIYTIEDETGRVRVWNFRFCDELDA